MSILIKGMKMPTSCLECPLTDGHSASCLITEKSVYFSVDKRHDGCPLVPVPPHGRLIDADALADVFRGFIAMYDSCPFSQLSFPDKARRDELQSALAEVINAPTIIPAEEG